MDALQQLVLEDGMHVHFIRPRDHNPAMMFLRWGRVALRIKRRKALMDFVRMPVRDRYMVPV